MMIPRYLPHASIDKKKWDESLARCSNEMMYAQSGFLDCVSPGWDALVGDDYSMLMPLTWRKKYAIRYLCQPPFTQQLGLFSSEPVISPEQLKIFIEAIPNHFRYADIFLNHKNNIEAGDNIRVFPRVTHLLPLKLPAGLLRNNYSTNLSRNLKKAADEQLHVDEAIPLTELIELFRGNRGKDIETLGDAEYNVLQHIWEWAKKKHTGHLYGVRTDGRLEAGALFLSMGREAIFLFSASGKAGKKAGAMSAVIDHFIAKHAGQDIVLDFEGSMDANLSRYYKSFGSAEIVYLHIRLNRLPGIIRWFKP
jgi:hypothetical protein